MEQTPFDPLSLETLAESYASACSQDLASLLSAEVELRGALVDSVSAEEAAAQPGAILHLRCRTLEEPPVPVHITVPRPDAVALAGLQLGEDASALKTRREEPMQADYLAAFEGVMKLAVAVLGRLFEEELARGPLELESTTEIEEPGSDPSWLGAQQLLRVSFDLSVGDFPKGQLEVLLPEGGEAATPGEDAGPIFVIDPSEDERQQVEELEAELARRVTGLDPNELVPDQREELATASLVIVAWDLGGRPGLELVESLAWDEQTEGVPILMSSEAPTRGMVAAALRAGAQSFLHRPYDANEIRRRAFGEQPEAASPEPDDAPLDEEASPEAGEPAGEAG